MFFGGNGSCGCCDCDCAKEGRKKNQRLIIIIMNNNNKPNTWGNCPLKYFFTVKKK